MFKLNPNIQNSPTSSHQTTYFIIRRIFKEEIPQVANLERTGNLTSFGEEIYRQQIIDPDYIYIALIEHTRCTANHYNSCVAGILSGVIVVEELQINALVVRPDLTRRGFGRLLLYTVLTTAAHRGCHRATLEVRSKNTPALQLYQSAGFGETGLRRNYYHNPADDAVLLDLSWA